MKVWSCGGTCEWMRTSGKGGGGGGKYARNIMLENDNEKEMNPPPRAPLVRSPPPRQTPRTR
jgi:hypothetical protein